MLKRLSIVRGGDLSVQEILTCHEPDELVLDANPNTGEPYRFYHHPVPVFIEGVIVSDGIEVTDDQESEIYKSTGKYAWNKNTSQIAEVV